MPGLDLASESVTVTEEPQIVMRATSLLIRRTGVPAFAVTLALLTVAFCLMDFVPTAKADPGCQGHTLCAQSGPSAPVAAVAQDVPQWEWTNASAIWLPLEPALVADSQRSTTPSAPRAPPLSLA
jgi:hypothetical protein